MAGSNPLSRIGGVVPSSNPTRGVSLNACNWGALVNEIKAEITRKRGEWDDDHKDDDKDEDEDDEDEKMCIDKENLFSSRWVDSGVCPMWKWEGALQRWKQEKKSASSVSKRRGGNGAEAGTSWTVDIGARSIRKSRRSAAPDALRRRRKSAQQQLAATKEPHEGGGQTQQHPSPAPAPAPTRQIALHQRLQREANLASTPHATPTSSSSPPSSSFSKFVLEQDRLALSSSPTTSMGKFGGKGRAYEHKKLMGRTLSPNLPEGNRAVLARRSQPPLPPPGALLSRNFASVQKPTHHMSAFRSAGGGDKFW